MLSVLGNFCSKDGDIEAVGSHIGDIGWRWRTGGVGAEMQSGEGDPWMGPRLSLFPMLTATISGSPLSSDSVRQRQKADQLIAAGRGRGSGELFLFAAVLIHVEAGELR